MPIRYLFPALLLAAVAAIAEPAPTDSPTQLEMLNEMNQLRIQLELERIEARLTAEMNDLRAEQKVLASEINQRNVDLSNYVDAISWISGIVIGFVGVIFGIGAFILYRENQDVTRKAQKQLESFNERAAGQQKVFESWFKQAKQGYAQELEQLGRIMRLRTLLDQDHPTSSEIYPDLSALFAHPKLEYLPIFRKVMTLDVSADIKRNTQTAIEQLTQMHRQE